MDYPIDKEQIMQQLTAELRAVLSKVVAQVNKVEFYHLIALLYIAISIAINLSPRTSVVGWLLSRYGLHGEFLSILFASSAIVIAYDASKRYFLFSLTPLALYALFLTLYSIDTGVFSITGTWYLITLIAFIYVLQFKTIGRFRLHHVYSFCMMLIGTGIFDSPTRGVAGWINMKYELLGQALGLSIILGAVLLAFNPRITWFKATTTMFVLYVMSSVVFNLTAPNGGMVNGWITVTMMVCVMWTYRHLDKYFEVL